MKNRSGIVRIVIGAVGIILLLTLFPTILTGFVSLWDVAASQTDSQDDVTTAVGVTTGNVTLTQTLLNGDVSNVASISSNITETPVADNYSSPYLYLTGLTANETRTLTTTYDYGVRSTFTAFPAVVQIVPTVLFLMMLFGGGYLVVSGARMYRKG